MASSAGRSHAAWRTSSSYSNNGGNCIEIAAAAGTIGARGTKQRAGTTLTFSPRAWKRFAASLKG
jgi:hypothetical protein